MKTIVMFSAALALVAGGSQQSAQEPPKACPPAKEHQWLGQLVGEWSFEAECTMDPAQPPMKCRGSEIARSLGDVWVITEGTGTGPTGAPMSSMITLGYDPQKKKFVGTCICSIMTELWIYEGSLDSTGKVLTLETEGPNCMAPGKTARYRDVIEIKSKDHRVFTSSILGEDGKWVTFATIHHRRTK